MPDVFTVFLNKDDDDDDDIRKSKFKTSSMLIYASTFHPFEKVTRL